MNGALHQLSQLHCSTHNIETSLCEATGWHQALHIQKECTARHKKLLVTTPQTSKDSGVQTTEHACCPDLQILEHVAAELALDSATVKQLNFLSSPESSSSSTAPAPEQQVAATAGNRDSDSQTAAVGIHGTAPAELNAGSNGRGSTSDKSVAAAVPSDKAGNADAAAAAGTGGSSSSTIYTDGRQCIGSPAALKQHIEKQQQQLASAGVADLAPAGAGVDDASPAAAAATAAEGRSGPAAATVAKTALNDASAAVEAGASPCGAAAAEIDSGAAAGGVTTVFGRHIAAESYTLRRVWSELLDSCGYNSRLEAVQRYNTEHAWSKRGIVMTPVRWAVAGMQYGSCCCMASFTSTYDKKAVDHQPPQPGFCAGMSSGEDATCLLLLTRFQLADVCRYTYGEAVRH